jgi:hypothetical protein
MASFRAIEMDLIEDLFEMRGGYVLQFSNRTFAEFFADDLGIDIYAAQYERNGTSKANRLRSFLRSTDAPAAARALQALWEYREMIRERSGRSEHVPRAKQRLQQLVERLGGKMQEEPSTHGVRTQPSQQQIHSLLSELMMLPAMAPQPRGYGFERFLTRLFNDYGLEAREPFKLVGEQIDGSFQLSSETYLLEAKWQAPVVGAGDLHGFHGKVEQKAAWARGLFISNSGFSSDGLVAFGRGKRVVLMDGGDLYELLHRALSLGEVIDRKVRYAAETGVLFVRVRDLFPL